MVKVYKVETKILTAKYPAVLQTKINKALSDGWHMYGDIVWTGDCLSILMTRKVE